MAVQAGITKIDRDAVIGGRDRHERRSHRALELGLSLEGGEEVGHVGGARRRPLRW